MGKSNKWGWAPRASNPGGRRGRDLQPPAPPRPLPRPAGISEMESGRQNNSEIGQAFRGAGGGAALRCGRCRGSVWPPLLCLRTRAVLQTKIATSTVATRRHPNMFSCVHKMRRRTSAVDANTATCTPPITRGVCKECRRVKDEQAPSACSPTVGAQNL